MTLNISVADDQLGAYYRKTAAIADRLGKSLRYEDVMAALQRIHDNDFEKPFVAQTVAEKPKKSSTVLAFREDRRNRRSAARLWLQARCSDRRTRAQSATRFSFPRT